MTNISATNHSNRDSLIDLLKGIGIISVVIGHSGELFSGILFSTRDFVYLYLLMIFFFSAGMVYKPDRQPNVICYALHQFKSTLPLYYGYCIAYLLLHNLFVHTYMLGEPLYSIRDTILRLPNLLLLRRTETLVGPLWFVPMFLFSKIIFHAAYQICERLFSSRKLGAHILVSVGIAAFGLFLHHFGIQLPYQMHHAFLRIPFFYLGFWFVQYRQLILKRCTPLGCVASALILILMLILGLKDATLFYYPISCIGLYFCLSLASVIQRFPRIKHFVISAGRNSFHIMALHITVSKLIDIVYGAFIHADPQVITSFPYAFKLSGLYSLAGVMIPLILVTQLRRRFRRV